jgi:hypothetical protein
MGFRVSRLYFRYWPQRVVGFPRVIERQTPPRIGEALGDTRVVMVMGA